MGRVLRNSGKWKVEHHQADTTRYTQFDPVIEMSIYLYVTCVPQMTYHERSFVTKNNTCPIYIYIFVYFHRLELNDDSSIILETAEERKSRKKSHIIISITTIVMCICFSITQNAVWPYLKIVSKRCYIPVVEVLLIVFHCGRIISINLSLLH